MNNYLKNKKKLTENNAYDPSLEHEACGVGMIATPGVTYRMFQALAKKKINILVISTSEIKISVLVNKKNTSKAISALHKELKLDK